MDNYVHQMLISINNSIIKIKGVYAAWARENQISYHELLVLYSLRDYEACTQRMICEQYLLPKQTVNNIVAELKNNGYIVLCPGRENWREKIIRLTEEGQKYSDSVLGAMIKIEETAVEEMGEKDLRAMTELSLRYGQLLEEGLSLARNDKGGGEK